MPFATISVNAVEDGCEPPAVMPPHEGAQHIYTIDGMDKCRARIDMFARGVRCDEQA